MIFGLYRIRIALTRTDEDDAKAKAKGGLYSMGKRTHLFVGIVYILLGGGLLATSFGWNPFGGSTTTDTPATDKAPTKLVPLEQKK